MCTDYRSHLLCFIRYVSIVCEYTSINRVQSHGFSLWHFVSSSWYPLLSLSLHRFSPSGSGTITAPRYTINSAAFLTRLRLLRGFVSAPPFQMPASRWVATSHWKHLWFNRHFMHNLYCYQGFSSEPRKCWKTLNSGRARGHCLAGEVKNWALTAWL